MYSNVYSVAFFGHRHINNPIKVEKLLEDEIYRLLRDKKYVDFLTGRSGGFDLLAASVVTRMCKQYRNDNSSLILILPYQTAEYQNNKKYYHEYYADIEICYASSISHPKSAIQIRNREMVDRADLILCYIEKAKGGAWQTVRYAKEKNKEIINLAERE